MKNQIEFRNSKRIRHESIISLKDDFGYPYYGMMYNVNQLGMYFQSLHELQPGKHLNIKIENLPPGLSQNSHHAEIQEAYSVAGMVGEKQGGDNCN